MLYPLYVHKDAESAYGAAFPDFPGCFAAADELRDLPAAAQEAVEAHFHGQTEPIPDPSAPEEWADDERFQGGYWMLVEIDLSRVNAKSVRLNVSLPQNLVARIDSVAQARRMSRSAFLALAAEHEMQSGIR
ncbi:type II toxin-antitoxin system HicB family antitoxin [Herbaspirillum seropedicae]|uniref:type II toxin-antitoxin system HicB family antitoxin n=1 Tax=Herbaspirillum seropedicae TaxID=964 RepID=UPI00084826F6|nr:type II toxin-antitoxin system HicB family antitoxin [Herbaspirillum seropedicae]AON54296.1 CopG family transcriptional regulator [Herbaspirillum seropedicae]